MSISLTLEQAIRIPPVFLALIGLTFVWTRNYTEQVRRIESNDDLGVSKPLLVNVMRGLHGFLMVSGFLFALLLIGTTAYGLLLMWNGRQSPQAEASAVRNIIFIVILSSAFWLSIAWHAAYRDWKTVNPRSLLSMFCDNVPVLRLWWDKQLRVLFGITDAVMPEASAARRVLRFLRPSASTLFLTAVALALVWWLPDFQHYWLVVPCVFLGWGSTKILYAAVGLERFTRRLYQLRDRPFGYLVVQKDGKVLLARQTQRDLPFYGKLAFPQVRLTPRSPQADEEFAEKAREYLRNLGIASKERPRYLLENTYKLYDDCQHDDWQHAHIFSLEHFEVLTSLPPAAQAQWVPVAELVELFAGAVAKVECPFAETVYWASASRPQVDLKNRPH